VPLKDYGDVFVAKEIDVVFRGFVGAVLKRGFPLSGCPNGRVFVDWNVDTFVVTE